MTEEQQKIYDAINLVHIEIAKLPIEMSEYTPISLMCIEAKNLVLRQVKKLNIDDVSNQRELLIAYELKLWINPTKEQIEISEKIVDMYLSD